MHIKKKTMCDRQYIWLVRYGKTFPGLIENFGNYDSDLHEEGIHHAKIMAERIASSRQTIHRVIADPFLRCMRTADAIAQHLGLKLQVEEGTTEWQVSSLLVDQKGHRTHPRSVPELQQLFSTIDESYASVNPQGPDRIDDEEDNKSTGCPRFPETEAQLHERCRTTLEKLLERFPNDSMVIVGHAPCVQSIALTLDGSPSPVESPWSLGGMTLFSKGSDEEKFTLEFYSDTSHMPGDYKEGKNGQWSLPSFVQKIEKGR